MNEKSCLSQSEKEALKCLTGGEALSLKELLLKGALVNVGLISADPEGNALSFPFLLFFLFFLVLTRDVVLTNFVVL